jgi:fibronectin type 3 domain-containing protein
VAVSGLGLSLIASTAKASIPGAPSWGSNYALVFSQDYTAMTSLSQVGVSSSMTLGTGNVWIAHTPTNSDWFDFISPNGNYDPFGVGSGYLDIRAQQNGSLTNNFDGYTSGLLSSVDQSGNGFAQEYGYFECTMWTPGGANTWPAFWLLDQPHVANPSANPYSTEIDITESYGNGSPNADTTTWHLWNGSSNPSNALSTAESGMTSGYHQYGVDIEPSGLTFYFDRQAIWTVPVSSLPSSTMLAKPMYLLLDLALGGGTYNNVTNNGYNYALTPNPSDLKVQYVAVWASPASPNYPAPPGAPTGLTATAGNQVVELAWNSTLGATSYNVYRGTSSGGESTTPIATGITGTSFNDTGLTNGVTYYYAVAAVNSHGPGNLSNEASATPRSGPPLPPGNLTVTQGDTQLTLNWSSSPDATSYNIYRGAGAGAESATPIATGVTATSFTDTGLANGQPDFYLVKGVNSLGNGAASNEANAIPASADGSCPVAYATSAPAIDGTENASWAHATVLPINHLTIGTSTSSDGVFETMWDSNYLYVLFTVNDSMILNGTPDYNGSAVEFYIDTNNSKSTSNGASDFRYTLGYNHTSVSEGNHNATTGVKFAQSTYSGGYREELAIPWSTLSVTPWSGQSIGIDAAIDDTTNTSQGRTDQLFWYNYYPTDYNDPQGFGNGTLNPSTPTPPAPAVYKLINVNSGLAMEVPNGTVGNGTALDQAAYTGATYQQWNVAQGYAGGYYLQNVSTSQVADTGPTFSNTDVVNEWNPNAIPDNDTTQLYTIVKLGNYYQIDNIYSGRVLDINGGSTSSGANIIQNNAAQNANSQLWQLVLISGAAPAAPTGLTATPGNAQVALSWTASAGATSYNVYRGTTAGGESSTPIATGVTATSYTNTGLTNGTTYYYKVAAVNSSGTSGQSSEASATPSGAPAAPTGLTATAGNAQVSLSWSASSGATSYNVYRGTTAGGEGTTAIATGITATSYTNTGLTNGTTYYYKVAAVNSVGTSGMSNEASATPFGAPAAPTGLTATAGNAQVSLSWSSATGATSYNLYRGTTSGGESTTAIATGITTTSYTNTGLTNGTTYYYKVAAVNSSGTSAMSNEASATPQSSGSIANGVYYIVSHCSNLGLDDPSGGGSGTALDQQADTGVNQQWVVTAVGGGEYKITSSVNGLAATGSASESPLTLATYTGASNQLWSFTASGSYYNIVNQATGQLMNDFNNNTSPGAYIGIWPTDGGGSSNEQWTLTPVSAGSIPNGTYYIVSHCSNLGLDDLNGGGSGTALDQQSDTGVDQQWVVTFVGSGEYKITSAVNGLAATGSASESPLTLATYTGASNQLWSFTASGSYYNIVNQATGQLMNDFNNNTSPGAYIGIWPTDGGGSPNEQWTLTGV